MPILLEGDEGRVLVDGGQIVDLNSDAVPDVNLDCKGATIEPGEVNAHTHLYSGLAPLGMPAPTPAPENFVQILERVWWRLDRALDADSLRASAELYVAEAVLSGTTTLIDHHESPNFIEGSLDVLADAFTKFGGRALLCYGATDRNGGADEGDRGLAECRRFIGRAQSEPTLVGAVGLHASFTVADDRVRAAAEMARALSAPLHVHVAEDGADVDDARTRGFLNVVDRFEKLDALVPGSIFAHGVHLTADEVDRLEQVGIWLVQNPRSNRGNGVGYPANLGRASRVALGTDGYPAKMSDERDALSEISGDNGDVVDPAARQRGSRKLAAALFGTSLDLEVGAAADIVVKQGDRVRHVLVNGTCVVRDGALVNGDIEEIRANAQAQAKLLWDRMEKI